MTNRGGLFGAALSGAGGVCISLETFCELFEMPLVLLVGTVGAFNDEAELL